MATFILPCDHRKSFAQDILGVSYPFSQKDRAHAQELKAIVARAVVQAQRTKHPEDTYMFLIDEETGTQALAIAQEAGVSTVVALEASGEQKFRPLYEEQSGHRLRMLGVSCGKILLHLNNIPKKTDENIRQCKKIAQELHAYGQKIIIEIISSCSEEERTEFIKKTITLMESENIIPTWWKVEPLPKEEDWNGLKKSISAQSGILMLGRGENATYIKNALHIAAQAHDRRIPAVEGFAIGRTFFSQPLKDVVEGKINAHQAAERIEDAFVQAVTQWKEVQKNIYA